jgi:hypothetical protein
VDPTRQIYFNPTSLSHSNRPLPLTRSLLTPRRSLPIPLSLALVDPLPSPPPSRLPAGAAELSPHACIDGQSSLPMPSLPPSTTRAPSSRRPVGAAGQISAGAGRVTSGPTVAANGSPLARGRGTGRRRPPRRLRGRSTRYSGTYVDLPSICRRFVAASRCAWPGDVRGLAGGAVVGARGRMRAPVGSPYSHTSEGRGARYESLSSVGGG